MRWLLAAGGAGRAIRNRNAFHVEADDEGVSVDARKHFGNEAEVDDGIDRGIIRG